MPVTERDVERIARQAAEKAVADFAARLKNRAPYVKHADLHRVNSRDPLGPTETGAAPDDASYVVIGASGGLSNERVLTAGANITITDGGAGSTVTIAAMDYEVTITVENPSATEDIVVRLFDQAVTIQEVHAVIKGGTSVSIDPVHGADRSAAGTPLFASAQVISSLTAGDSLTSFADATLNAGDSLRLKTTAVVGSVTELSVTFRYRRT